MSLLDDVAKIESLTKAWKHVKRNRRASYGIDKISVDDFGNNLDQHLQTLHKDLVSRTYKFNKVIERHIPKKDKATYRKIAIYSIKDKIVLKSLQLLFENPNNPLFPDTRNSISIGFIRKLTKNEVSGIKLAIQKIPSIFKSGNVVMTSADICDFFDKININELHQKILDKLHPDTSLDWLIPKILEPEVCLIDRSTNNVTDLPHTNEGVSQGSVLSPLLSNIYLSDFDKAVESMHLHAFRYADDFVFFTKDIVEAKKTLAVIEKLLLKRFNLVLHPLKSHKGPKHYQLDIEKRFGLFLGIRLEYLEAKKTWLFEPVPSKVTELKEKIKNTLRISELTFSERITNVNVIVQSWNKTYQDVGCTVARLKTIYSEIRTLYLAGVNELLRSHKIISKNLNEDQLNFLGVLTFKYLFGVPNNKKK